MPRPRQGSGHISRSFSWAVDDLPLLEEVEEDFGGITNFVRHSITEYVRAKGALSPQAAREDIRRSLLMARRARAEALEVANRSEKEMTDRRLEALAREDEERRASGAASARFETPDELVAYYRPRLPVAGDGNWRNIAQRHGMNERDVLAVVHRDAAQSVLPKRQHPPKPSRRARHAMEGTGGKKS